MLCRLATPTMQLHPEMRRVVGGGGLNYSLRVLEIGHIKVLGLEVGNHFGILGIELISPFCSKATVYPW